MLFRLHFPFGTTIVTCFMVKCFVQKYKIILSKSTPYNVHLAPCYYQIKTVVLVKNKDTYYEKIGKQSGRYLRGRHGWRCDCESLCPGRCEGFSDRSHSNKAGCYS